MAQSQPVAPTVYLLPGVCFVLHFLVKSCDNFAIVELVEYEHKEHDVVFLPAAEQVAAVVFVDKLWFSVAPYTEHHEHFLLCCLLLMLLYVELVKECPNLAIVVEYE